MKKHGPLPEMWTDDQRREWAEWLRPLPEKARVTTEQYPPWQFYRLPEAAKPDDYYAIVSVTDDGGVRLVRFDADSDEALWSVYLEPSCLAPVSHVECCGGAA